MTMMTAKRIWTGLPLLVVLLGGSFCDDNNLELELLGSKVAALEELLSVQERTVAEQSARLVEELPSRKLLEDHPMHQLP